MTTPSHDSTAPAHGTLYVVATPIGNLADLSPRAAEVLRRVSLILCEDTRHTRSLLVHHGIGTATSSYHEHNGRQKAPQIIERLDAGAEIALVSDAGTPTVSDPGYRLLNAVRGRDVTVVPIPGPSAVTAILSVCGLPTDRFVFEGFLPPKKGKRQRRLTELAGEWRTIVLFESPLRLARNLAECLGAWGDRDCCLGRELTKRFEEVKYGTLGELVAWAQGRSLKGEITIAVGGADRPPAHEEADPGDAD